MMGAASRQCGVVTTDPLAPAAAASELEKSHRDAVIRVIEVLRQGTNPGLALGEMARIALISRFHFDRLFRQIVGISPSKFQSALRIAHAKRLLLTSNLTALDVCLAVGYNSLGTFTRRFAQMVGTPPRGLRRLVSGRPVVSFPHTPGDTEPRTGQRSISGTLRFPEGFEGFAIVGLFDTPVPQGHPLSCAVVTGDAPGFTLPAAEGDYFALSAAMSMSANSVSVLLNDVSAVGRTAVNIREGATPHIEIQLRPMEITDPPIITAVNPFLLRQLLAQKTLTEEATQ
jgi:AraC family transcriptional regulator